MARKTFIPNWYLDKKIQRKNKKNKLLIMVISIVNIILICFILNNSNRRSDIDQKLGNANSNSIVVEAVKLDMSTIEKYKELSDFLEGNNLSYKDMVITRKSLEVDIEVKSYEEYIHAIKSIENHYSIKGIGPNIKNKGSFYFNVILEV